MLQNLSDFLYEGSTQGQLWFLHNQDGQVSRGVKVSFCAQCASSAQPSAVAKLNLAFHWHM